jgi:gamma-glutamylcyclotransferase (GGCT)/AIG2-like uncharacterized protein YtfP
VERAELEEVVAAANRLRGRPGGGTAEAAAWERLAARLSGSAGAPDPPGTAAERVEALLGHPGLRLAAYGTLRPGEANHALVAGLGPWRPGWIRGTRGDWCGYPIVGPGTARVPVMVLTSARLADRMADLDEFEGPAYRRAWVVVEHDASRGGDALVVAQCYIAALPARSSGDRPGSSGTGA